MAAGDYRSCDVCGGKAFYDANLDYDTGDKIDGTWVYSKTPYRVGGEDQGEYAPGLGYVGDWAVICTDCAKTHRTAILPILPDNAGGERRHTMSTEETNPPAVVLSTAQLSAAPLFVVVRNMNYTGEILHGKWDGARYYMLDDGDCYTPERLADEYKAEFLDAEPNAGAEPREASASGNLLYDTRKNT